MEWTEQDEPGIKEIELARSALDHYQNADLPYDTWLNVGMSLSELGPAGLALWIEWSQRSKKYIEGVCEAKWASIRPGGRDQGTVGLGSLFYLARACGWNWGRNSVTISPGLQGLGEKYSIALNLPEQQSGIIPAKYQPQEPILNRSKLLPAVRSQTHDTVSRETTNSTPSRGGSAVAGSAASTPSSAVPEVAGSAVAGSAASTPSSAVPEVAGSAVAGSATSTPSSMGSAVAGSNTDIEVSAVAGSDIDIEGPIPNVEPPINNPRRLAEIMLKRRYRHKDHPTLISWGNIWWVWKAVGPSKNSWSVIEIETLKNVITLIAEDEFHLEWLRWLTNYERERQAAQQRGEKPPGEPPPLRPVTQTLINNVLGSLRAHTALEEVYSQPAWLGTQPSPFPTDCVLPTRSALVNIETVESIPPTPSFFCPYALEFDYLPDAPPPIEWLKFLSSIWGADADTIGTLQEWYGYCLTPQPIRTKSSSSSAPPALGKGSSRATRETDRSQQ